MTKLFTTITLLGSLLSTSVAQADTVLQELKTLEGGVLTISLEEPNLVENDDVKDVGSVLTGVGGVIQMGRDLVALGEELYVLVAKGRPNVTTQYAPISVLPREGDQAVNVMDMDDWKKPISRKLSLSYKYLGMTVAKMDYAINFAYGGSYNGKGAYITGAQIVPSASSSFGVDFDATMSLIGITNHGTRDNPIAGANLQLKYSIQTLTHAVQRSLNFLITGQGEITAI